MLVAEIGNYLHNKGIGTFDATGATGNIFILTQPTQPDNCIAIYPRGGPPADAKLGYDNTSVEILVRGVYAVNTFDTAQRIYNLMHGMKDKYFMPLGFYVINCLADQSAPNYIGKDDNKRFEFSLNFTIQIKNFEGNRDNGNTKI